MKNMLMKTATNAPLEKLNKRLTDLQRDEATLENRIEANTRTREENAPAAYEGDGDARKLLERSRTDRFELDGRIDDVRAAIAQTRREIVAAEAEAQEAEMADVRAKIDKLMVDREAHAKKAEKAFLQAVESLDAMAFLGAQIETESSGYHQPNNTDGTIRLKPDDMSPSETVNRFNNFVCAIGLDKYLNVINWPSDAHAAILADKGSGAVSVRRVQGVFVDAEITAHQAYKI